MSLLELEGKVAFLSGSSRGIGWRAAELLAENGATVVINGRDAATLDDQAADLRRRFGGEHSAVAADAADADAVRAAVRSVFGTHRRLDILVNNAGVLDDALIGMVSDEALERTFAVNTFAAIHFIQSSARIMARHGGGSIVNVSSIIGMTGNRGQIAYSASKAALIGATRSAAKELAPSGIRVNAVAPGFIDTAIARQVPEPIFQERIDSIAMGRIGQPDDVAGVVLFLASDLARYVTGQVLGVDGGMVI